MPTPHVLNAEGIQVDTADLVIMGVYLVLILLAGIFLTRLASKNIDSYFLGGRRIPWWAVGISIFGTSVSAITYIAIPATAYAEDWVTLLNSIGIIFLAPFVAIVYLPKLREADHVTAYEYLEKRFNL